MKRTLLLFICVFSSQLIWCQVDTLNLAGPRSIPELSSSLKVYKTHPGWEIPVSLAVIIGESLGYKEMDKVASLTQSEVLALDPQSINAFDRPAAFYDPAGFTSAESNSDILMTICVASPLFLVFDKKIRKDWADMLGMLLMAHAVDNTILFGAFFSVRRPRPITYNPAVALDSKTGVGKTNSFFSGHVSWAAASSFFLVKVYTDYHQIKGWRRLLMYTGAAIPPAVVGYYRMHAGRHFETDAITGLVVGAACGILVPEVHRIKDKVPGLSMQPFFMFGSSGLALSYKIK